MIKRLTKTLLTLGGLAAFFPSVGWADAVVVEWQKTDSASQYELEVRSAKEVILDQIFPREIFTWKGNLPFGVYSYRLRTLDAAKRASPWSDPSPFLVTPAPPQLLLPPNASTVIFRPGAGIAFKWSASKGVDRYLLELSGAAAEPLRRIVNGTQTSVGGLRPGSYTWKIKPVLDATNKKTNEMQSQVIDAKASETWNFRADTMPNSPVEPRTIASAPVARATTEANRRRFALDLSAGLQLGSGLFLPTVRGQFALGGGFAMGLRALYASDAAGSATLDAWGGLATFSWYSGAKNFQGFFGEAGLGGFSFSARDGAQAENGKFSAAGYLTGGWSWHPSGIGLHFDLSVGAEYIDVPKVSLLRTSISGWLPLGMASVGYAF